MPREHLFYLDGQGRIRCFSKGRACGDRDQMKFRGKLGLPGDRPAGTLHHMVPWGQLWRVLEASFAEIRRNDAATILEALLPVCYSHTRLSGHSARLTAAVKALGPRNYGVKTKAGTEMFLEVREGFSPNDGEELCLLDGDTAVYDLVNHWCWMPGNLFLGSSTRSDDPGDFGFDHPPREIKKHGSNLTADPAHSFESRVSDLFGFFDFLKSKSDEALYGQDRSQLIDLLTGLQFYRLWTPFQLVEEVLGKSFLQRGGRYYVADPMILSHRMRENYEERLEVLGPPYNGNYEKYCKAKK